MRDFTSLETPGSARDSEGDTWYLLMDDHTRYAAEWAARGDHGHAQEHRNCRWRAFDRQIAADREGRIRG